VGAEVIGEHDWIDDIGIGFDLLCTAATDERAAAIAGELADHLVLPHQAMPLPPWAGELTDEQQAIRRSYRVELSRRQATSERMTSSRAFIQAAQDLADALASGDPDDIAMRQAELAEVFDHDRPTEVSDDVHPIVASWAALDTAFGPPADEVWLSRGVALGQTDYRMVNGEHAVRSGAAAATTVYFGSAGVDGDHVQLGSFHGPAMGTLLPTISDHLESVGCTDLTYTLVDADLLWNL